MTYNLVDNQLCFCAITGPHGGLGVVIAYMVPYIFLCINYILSGYNGPGNMYFYESILFEFKI